MIATTRTRPSVRYRSLCAVFGAAVSILAGTGCVAQQSGPSGGLAAGLQLFSQHDLDGTEVALAALPNEASARDRASALQIRGLIAWRFRLDWETAEGLLREALELDAGRSESWAALARLEIARDRYEVAREAALEAVAAAETKEDAVMATTWLARAAIARAEATFDRAPSDALDSLTIDWLREAHDQIRVAVSENPGDLDAAIPLLHTSLFLGDGDALLAAWRSTYLTIAGKPDAGVLEGPRQTLDALLPGWTDRPPTASAVGQIVLALARSAMYREASIAAHTPGWTGGVEPAHAAGANHAEGPKLSETLAYARFVHKATALTDEYYRRLALGEADTAEYRRAFLGLAEPLWEALGWDGERPRLTTARLIREIDERFDAEMRGGSTAGYQDLHFGHRVIDERIVVSQYGHEANLRFVSLDGMVSNGFQSWAWDYRSQHGGWARSDGITQVRSAYAGTGQQVWRILSDSIALQRVREETALSTAQDWERAAENPHAFLPGLRNRLRAQGADRLLDGLRAQGLEGDALKRRFLVEIDAAVFASSIVAHEGRHAIDERLGNQFSSADLEFRAKLSEVVFAPHPRIAFGAIINGSIGDQTPHGQANGRVMKGLVSWLASHSADIPGLDVSHPLLPQLDKLTDDQLKAVMASMDPLAP